MLGITSAQLQWHPGTLTGHGRAHPSQGRFSSSSASQSPEQTEAQQSTSCSVLVEAGMDGADRWGRESLSYQSPSVVTSLRHLIPFLTLPCSPVLPPPFPNASQTPEAPLVCTAPCPPSHAAQHRAQQDTPCRGEATAGTSGTSGFPPSSSRDLHHCQQWKEAKRAP